MDLDAIVAQKRVVVCVGSGGVGKTTTAAAIALHAARTGKRALVMTIDPARRLANSLGLSSLDHEQRRVDPARLAAAQLECPGELWAMMLDAKSAFDEMVIRNASSPEARDRILANRIYQYISTRLPGSQEYMAMEKLHEIDAQGRYDLLVLDTPPTANALDFLDAPQKLVDAIDSAAIRWFLKPFEKGQTRFSFKVLGQGSAYVLKMLSRFTGAGLLEEIAHFLAEFNQLLAGFKDRAARTVRLLRDDRVRFVLVTSPEPLAIDEATFFYGKLREAHMPFGAFVVNRVNPDLPEPPPPAELSAMLAARRELGGRFPAASLEVLADDLAANQREQRALSAIDRHSIERLRSEQGAAAETLIAVPILDTDVHDLAGLDRLCHHLFRSREKGVSL